MASSRLSLLHSPILQSMVSHMVNDSSAFYLPVNRGDSFQAEREGLQRTSLYPALRARIAAQCLVQFAPGELVGPRDPLGRKGSLPCRTVTNKNTRQKAGVFIWRRERDSNPRWAFDPYSLSRGAPSAARPPLRKRFNYGASLLQPWLQAKRVIFISR